MWSLLLLFSCASPPVLQGKVVDIWGKPIDEATVVIEGVVERYYTDGGGLFHIETDAQVQHVMAGKSGYIKNIVDVKAPAEHGDDYDPLTFQLYPKPEKPGFYAIGPSEYVKVDPQRIVMVGTELRHYAGLRDVAASNLGSDPGRFVFTTQLKFSEISRMNLHLSRMKWIAHTPVKGILGPVDATVNLWVADEEVPFDLASLQSHNDFLITAREKLPPGMYAFHAQDVLNEADERVFLMMPKEMQVAFPFEVD